MGEKLYASPQFPFMYMRVAGVLLLVFGLAELSLGVVDVLYTELRYGAECNVAQYQNWKCGQPDQSPCGFHAIVYSRVAIGIWGAFFVIITGGVAASFRRNGGGSIRAQRDAVAAFATILTLLVGPATIAVVTLRLIETRDVFYCADPEETLLVADFVEFLLPIMTVIALFLGWCVGVGILFSLCKNGKLYDRDEAQYAEEVGYLRPRTYARSSSHHRPLPERPQMYPSASYWDPQGGYFGNDRRYRFPDDRGYWSEPEYTSRERSRWRKPMETIRKWTRSYRSMPYPSDRERRRPYRESYRMEEPRGYRNPYYVDNDGSLDRNYFTTRTYNRY